MNGVKAFYQYVSILSLDVAAGAVICALFFAHIFRVSVSPYALAALGLTVWIIYTIDHLRDAKTIRSIASTDRHRFHQQHFATLVVIVAAMMVFDIGLVWFVPERVLFSGLMLWSVVLTYLVLQHYLKFLKEFFVALLYTAGVLLPAMAEITTGLEPIHYVLIGKFFITALMNLLLFSLFDYKQDTHQRQHSFVTWFGPVSTRLGILFLGLLNILSGVLLWSFDPKIALIFISMNLMLLSILFLQKYMVRKNYYRILGDAVFFIPVVYIL